MEPRDSERPKIWTPLLAATLESAATPLLAATLESAAEKAEECDELLLEEFW
jgi:hypothetical protein